MNPIKIAIDFEKSGKHFKHFYNAVGYANVDYTYTEPAKVMYDYLSSYNNHFRYMRLHNILTAHGKGDYYLVNHGQDYGNPPQPLNGKYKYVDSGDTVISMDEKGDLQFDWTVVDKVYDIFQEHGIHPIVETVYMPRCLQKSMEEWFIPKDYNLWREVLQEFVKHLQERYGKEEVEQWYFEIWNEPDNHKLWVENSDTFLALYDYMEDAIHSVNPKIKVGGPAVKQGEEARIIYRRFLDHCAKGLNYVSGKFGTRVDFISVHCKGGWQDGYNPSSDVMFHAVTWFLEVLKEYPEFEGIEFFNDESDIVWNGNLGTWYKSWLNFRNTHYPPGFICKMVHTYCSIVEDQYGVNLSIVDSDNCHIQWEKFLFSGNRSQLTPLMKYGSADLIKKPIFNAYVLLSRLGSQRANVECGEEGYGNKFGVLPTLDKDVFSVMVWNFEDGMDDDINERRILLSLKGMSRKGKYKLIHYRIDKEHSSSYNIWREMKKPQEPTVEQIKRIREREGLELYEEIRDIQMIQALDLEVFMPMHSVSLLLLVPENLEKPASATFIKGVVQEGYNKNPQVFLKWKPNVEKDFLYYRVLRMREDEVKFTLVSDNTSINTAIYMDMDVKIGYEYSYKIQSVNASMIESELSEELSVRVG